MKRTLQFVLLAALIAAFVGVKSAAQESPREKTKATQTQSDTARKMHGNKMRMDSTKKTGKRNMKDTSGVHKSWKRDTKKDSTGMR